MTELADVQLSRVVLVGVGKFSDRNLFDLPSVANNLDSLYRTLTDPDWWGLPPENCVVVTDQRGPVEARHVREALRNAARYVEELLLVYYAGHGLPLDPGDLVLATTDTERDSPRERGVPIDEVRDVFLGSRARFRILILDCCYSGRALEHMGMDKATATLTSVSAIEPGNAPERAEFTEFSGHLVGILHRGIPEERPVLTLRMIAEQIRKRPDAERLARLQDSQGAADLPLVRNVRQSSQHHVTADLTKIAYVVQGIDAVATRICRTIGPRGRANLIPGRDGVVREVDDPATVVAYYEPVGQPDEVGIGVGYIRDLVHVMYRQAGDGGATAVAIAQALVAGVFEAMRHDRHLRELIDGVEQAFAMARDTLEKWAVPVGSTEQLISVARSSARANDIGELVAESVNQAAVSGAVLVEKGHRHDSHWDFVPGLRVGSGSVGREFHTDPVRGEAKLDEPLVVVEDQLTVEQVRSALARAKKAGKPLAIFASDVDGDTLAAAATEARTPNGPGLLVVALPSGVAGAAVARRIRNLLKPPRKGLGAPRQVLATGDHTLMVWTSNGDTGNEPPVDRLPIIRVSAHSDAEWHAMRRLTEAAVSSAFAATLDGGTVAGGGIALRDVARRLREWTDGATGDRPKRLRVKGDRIEGVRIAADALAAPARHMAENARLTEEDLRKLLGAKRGVGMDLVGERTVDMVEHGIIDPVKVIRVAMAEALETVRRFIRLA